MPAVRTHAPQRRAGAQKNAYAALILSLANIVALKLDDRVGPSAIRPPDTRSIQRPRTGAVSGIGYVVQ